MEGTDAARITYFCRLSLNLGFQNQIIFELHINTKHISYQHLLHQIHTNILVKIFTMYHIAMGQNKIYEIGS